jgi:hypothetical protein
MKFSVMGIAHGDAPDKEENRKGRHCKEAQF